MQKNFFILVLLTASALRVMAQPCSFVVSGTVTSVKAEPLPGASVQIASLQRGVVADADGSFRLEGLCAGEYKLTARYLGYITVEKVVCIARNETWAVVLEPDATELKEIVVEEKPAHLESARNFVQLSEKQLSEVAGKSLGEALREVSGVSSVQAGPGIFKPVIHGVHSQRVLILNHGVRQEGQQWGAEHAPEIDPFIASDITVIKDASSIKYGADAIGGVVVVNPPSLPREAGIGGSLQMIGQSNGRSGTVAGVLEGGVKNIPGLGWRVQSSAKRAGDFHTPTYNLTNTGLKELNFSVASAYHTDKKGVEVFFSHFQTTVGILKGTAISNLDDLLNAMESDVPQNTSAFSYDISEPRQEVSHDLLKMNGHLTTAQGDWRLQYGFQNNQRREFDIRRGDLSKLPAIDLQLFTHTLEAEWESTTREHSSFCAGVTALYQNNNNVPGTQRIPFIPNFTTAAGGAFGVANFYFKNVSIDAGIRYDFKNYDVVGYDFKNSLYRNTLNFHNVSATMGTAIEVGAHQTISSSLSTAWRPPHVAELFSLGTHQSAAAIEYGLFLNEATNEVMNAAEVSFRNEKGLKWVNTYQWNRGDFRFEGSAYVNYIFNYFYLRPTGITQNVRGLYPYFRYTQTDALFVGVDVSASWRAARNVKVNPKVTWLQARDVSNDDYLVFIPPNRAELALRYELEQGKHKGLYVEAKGKYTMRQSRAPRVISVRTFQQAMENDTDPLGGSNRNFDFMAAPDGYFLVGLATGFSLTGKKVKYDFRASAENLLNVQYRDYMNRFRYYADELGRNLVLSVKCIF